MLKFVSSILALFLDLLIGSYLISLIRILFMFLYIKFGASLQCLLHSRWRGLEMVITSQHDMFKQYREKKYVMLCTHLSR